MRQLLAVALATAALAGCATSQAPRIDPDAPFAAEIAAFLEADRQDFPARCQTLFVGSSSFRLWDTLAEDMAPRPVIRRGFGGSEMSQLNDYFDAIVAPYAPSAIVVYEGENDLWNGKTPDEVAADYAVFMEMKTEALGATPVYVVSIKASKLRFGQLDTQARANAMLESMAATREDMVFIDVVPAMLDADGMPRDIFIFDQLHMNADGYALWTPLVRDALDTAPASRAPHCGA